MLFVATREIKYTRNYKNVGIRNVDASKAVGYKECLRARIDVIRFKIDYDKPLS